MVEPLVEVTARAHVGPSPRVSVLMAFLDPPLGYFEEAIASVLAQSFSDFEILLIDDGSTDAASDFARSYAARYPDKIRYLEHRGHSNQGLSRSRNLGIRSSRAEYLAFLDADDVWLPDKLRDQVELLDRHRSAGLVYGVARYWYSWKDPASGHQDFSPPLGLRAETVCHPPTVLARYLRGKAAVPCPSDMMVRRSALERSGGFEDSFSGPYEDQAFFAKMALVSPFLPIEKTWSLYRQHTDSMMAVVSTRDGLRAARSRFLLWLEQLLIDRMVEDPMLWEALTKEIWMWGARDSSLNRDRRFEARRLAKKWLLRTEEALIPAGLRQRIWRRGQAHTRSGNRPTPE